MHTTFITQRALRLADFSPVPDEKMVGAAPEFFWDRRHQLLLYAFHCFVLGKTKPLRHAENVGVHSERRNMKGIAEHHVRRFATNARQLLQLLAFRGHLAVVFFHEHFRRLDDAFALVAIEPDRI